MKDFSVKQLLGALVVLLTFTPITGLSDETDRALYREAKALIDARQFNGIQDRLFALRDYPLHSYLEADLILARLDDISPQTVDMFLEKHRDSVVAKKMLRPWLQYLARQKAWDQFLAYYSPEYGSDSLRCHYVKALQANDRPIAAEQEIASLWQTGYSLPQECDALLEAWLDEHPQREKLLWQRSRLALQAGQISLAQYLLKQIPVDGDIINLLDHPETLGAIGDSLPADDNLRAIVFASLQNLVRRDYRLAEQLWNELHERFSFNNQQQFALRQQIGRYLIANGEPETDVWLAEHDPSGEDEYLMEWRVKLALKANSWPQVQDLILQLQPETQAKPEWRYWLARAQIAQQGNEQEQALGNLKQLSQQRGYYSFLAADFLQVNYSLRSREQRFPALNKQLQELPAIQRARELHAVGENYWANREWSAAGNGRSEQELASMAELAKSWGWYNQGILTAIRAGQRDDLTLRFPLAFDTQFSQTAREQEIQLNWLYAIARKESAFSERAVSPVGARGVMQIMPYTARDLANELGWRYEKGMLFESDQNIRMGGYYLNQLLERFNGSRVLATAAYNAGPAAIEKVLERQQQRLPFDIWVETLPLSETRDYVKGVLAFAIVYSHQLGQKIPLVASNELFIEPSTTLTAANEADRNNTNISRVQ